MRVDDLLFEGRIGLMRVEDVLQFVAQAGFSAALEFESEDRADGTPRAVDLTVREGRIIGIGPRGTGLRLGDLAVGRRVATRPELEAAASETPIGRILVERGWLDEPGLEDLLYERHARVIWSLASWDRGRFRARAMEPAALQGRAAPANLLPPGAIAVTPPIPIETLLLDRLQRVEIARAESPKRS